MSCRESAVSSSNVNGLRVTVAELDAEDIDTDIAEEKNSSSPMINKA